VVNMRVAEILQQMAVMVRSGDIAGAATLGNAGDVKLAVPQSEVATGQVIGRGSESMIMSAHYKGSEVALKKNIIRCTADLERFRKEVAVLSGMRHEHVVPLLGACAVPPCYSMIIPLYTCSLEVCICVRPFELILPASVPQGSPRAADFGRFFADLTSEILTCPQHAKVMGGDEWLKSPCADCQVQDDGSNIQWILLSPKPVSYLIVLPPAAHACAVRYLSTCKRTSLPVIV
jgi:hypothetical protein